MTRADDASAMTGEDATARADRRARLAIAGLIVAGVLIRLLLLRAPGFPPTIEA